MDQGSRCSSGSSGSVDVERVHDLQPSHIKPSEPSSPLQPQVSSDSHPQSQAGVDMVTEGAEAMTLADEFEEEKKEAEETTEHREDGSQILETSSPPGEEEDKKGEKEEEQQPSEAVESPKDDARQDGDKAEVSGISPPQDESVVVLYGEESRTELTKILLAAFRRCESKFSYDAP